MKQNALSPLEYIARLFFPPCCICCRKLLRFDALQALCGECENNLPVLIEREYGLTLEEGNGRVFSVFDYEGGIRQAIHGLKYSGNPSDASILIDLSFPMLRQYLFEEDPFFRPLPKYDIIIPVPVHFSRKRQRGYNQSEILASHLKRHMGIPVVNNALVKRINTPPQSTLNRGERIGNLKDAFQVKRPGTVSGQRILLVDDVMTTGTTLGECRKALLASGAVRVDGFVVAVRRKLQPA